jgi:hypothetical protein
VSGSRWCVRFSGHRNSISLLPSCSSVLVAVAGAVLSGGVGAVCGGLYRLRSPATKLVVV